MSSSPHPVKPLTPPDEKRSEGRSVLEKLKSTIHSGRSDADKKVMHEHKSGCFAESNLNIIMNYFKVCSCLTGWFFFQFNSKPLCTPEKQTEAECIFILKLCFTVKTLLIQTCVFIMFQQNGLCPHSIKLMMTIHALGMHIFCQHLYLRPTSCVIVK